MIFQLRPTVTREQFLGRAPVVLGGLLSGATAGGTWIHSDVDGVVARVFDPRPPASLGDNRDRYNRRRSDKAAA